VASGLVQDAQRERGGGDVGEQREVLGAELFVVGFPELEVEVLGDTGQVEVLEEGGIERIFVREVQIDARADQGPELVQEHAGPRREVPSMEMEGQFETLHVEGTEPGQAGRRGRL